MMMEKLLRLKKTLNNSSGKKEFEDFDLIYGKILNFLSYKPRAERETLFKLDYYLNKRKSLSEDEKNRLRDYIVSTLKSEGFLDDKRYVELMAENYRSSSKPKSLGKLRNNLRKKYISTEVIESVLNTIDEILDVEFAAVIAKKKLHTVKASNLFERKMKIQRYLLSKGYSNKVISAVFDTIEELK